MANLLSSFLFSSLIWSVATPQYTPRYPNDPQEALTNRNKLREEVIFKMNEQVSHEMRASLVYMAMGSYFNSEKQDRPGFGKFFRKNSDEEREHAQKFSDYLNRRGSTITRFDFKMPSTYEWANGLAALRDALTLENMVTDKLMEIHRAATEVNDGHLTDFLESEFLGEQIESIRQLQSYINILEHMSHENKGSHDKHEKHDMLAEYLFDLKLQGKDYANTL